METLQQTNEQGLTYKEFHKLFDEVHDETWDLRCSDGYESKYEHYANRRPDLTANELQAKITSGYALEYAKENGFDETKTTAFALFAAAPNYAINQARKNIYGPDDNNLKVVSNFNGLARDFVTLHPEVDKDQLSARLVESIADTGIDNEFTNDDELREAMDATIAGVRTESGFEQLLTYADIPFKRGDTQQDLAAIDYLVPSGKTVLKIDVKSSNKGTGSDTEPYRLIGPDHYKLLRLFGPGDFKANSFKLREESLENKAFATRALIDKLA